MAIRQVWTMKPVTYIRQLDKYEANYLYMTIRQVRGQLPV